MYYFDKNRSYCLFRRRQDVNSDSCFPLLTRASFGVPYDILISPDSGSKSDALCACTMWE